MPYFDALGALIVKNFKLTFRQRFSFFAQLLAPIIAIFLLFLVELTIRNNDGFNPNGREVRNPSELKLGTIPRCNAETSDECTSIAYVHNGNETVEKWINQLADQSQIPPNEVRPFETTQQLNQHLIESPNTTQGAYIFEQNDFDRIDRGAVSYTVQYNQTSPQVFPLGTTNWNTDFLVPTMVVAMNNILFPAITGAEIALNFTRSIFPHPEINPQVDDAFLEQGPFFLYATYSLSVVFFVAKLVEEKEKKLRIAMKLAGQYQSQHFLSWSLLFVTFLTLTTFLLIAAGHAFRFNFFTRTSFPVYFITFQLFALSLIPWIFLYDIIIRKGQDVIINIFCLFIVFYLMAGSASILYAVDENDDSIVTGGATNLRQFFALFPPVMFSKCVSDIAIAAAAGRRLSMEDIDDNAVVFPIRTCWLWIMATSVGLMVLVVYLDNVVPNGYSTPLRPWYLFSPRYWGGGKRKKYQRIVEEYSNSSSESDYDESLFGGGGSSRDGLRREDAVWDPDVEDADVRRERELIEAGRRDRAPLVIRNIRKKFGKFTAVDGVSLAVRSGELIGILGHNGTGKTTLYNMLTGLIPITSGSAAIYGLDVRQDQSSIRRVLGVCPQHDILFGGLKATENMNVFAALKGIPRRGRPAEIKSRLVDVELGEFSELLSSQLSGGMQRKLSLAISLIGDPKLVLLDEPSSGADPIARREVWNMIERAKQDRVIVLVTHSMAEAETLADRICIMARGKLRALGTNLHLKTKFGSGYQLRIHVRDRNKVEEITRVLSAQYPEVKLERVLQDDPDGLSGLAEYSFERNPNDTQMAEMVKALEEKEEEFGIDSFGLGKTTLEDVFIRITRMTEDDDVNELAGRRCIPSCCKCW